MGMGEYSKPLADSAGSPHPSFFTTSVLGPGDRGGAAASALPPSTNGPTPPNQLNRRCMVQVCEDGRGRFKTTSSQPARIADREKKAPLKS